MLTEFSIDDSGTAFYSNDVCLLITSASLDVDSLFVKNITLPEESDCVPGSACSVSGWGLDQVYH